MDDAQDNYDVFVHSVRKFVVALNLKNLLFECVDNFVQTKLLQLVVVYLLGILMPKITHNFHHDLVFFFFRHNTILRQLFQFAVQNQLIVRENTGDLWCQSILFDILFFDIVDIVWICDDPTEGLKIL